MKHQGLQQEAPMNFFHRLPAIITFTAIVGGAIYLVLR